MPVAGKKQEIVLDGERRNPDVVDRNRRPLQTKLREYSREVMRGFIVGEQHPDALGVQEDSQRLLVLSGERPAKKSRPQLGKNDKWQTNDTRQLDDIDRFLVAFAKIAIAVGIEQNPHRHISGSTRSKTS